METRFEFKNKLLHIRADDTHIDIGFGENSIKIAYTLVASILDYINTSEMKRIN